MTQVLPVGWPLQAEADGRDYVLVNRVKTPGLAIITPPNSPRGWDVQQGYALSGAWCRYTGAGLAKFDITLRFWKEEQSAEWDEFANQFLVVTEGKKPQVLGVYHPLFVKPPARVDKIVVEDVQGWTQVEDGIWETKISCLQYKELAPVKTKPDPGVPAASKPTPPIQDQADADVAARLAQIKALGG